MTSSLPSFESAFSGPFVEYDIQAIRFRGGIQLPQNDSHGVVYMHNPESHVSAGNYLYEDMNVAYKHSTHLSGLLAELGVQLAVDESTKQAYCKFRDPDYTAKAAETINKELPPNHCIPNFKTGHGSDLPAEDLLAAMAYERAFTLATGEGDTPHDSPIRLLGQKPPHAYYGVHDFIVHLTTMVSTEPTKVMGYVRAQALAGLQADQTPDLYGITAAGRAMRSLDQTLTSDFKRGIGCVAARLESQPEPFISAFNVDNGTAKHLAELSLDHVVFLMEQFPAR